MTTTKMTRLSFDVTPELNRVIEDLVEATHSRSKSELLRKAVALMTVAVEAKQNGEHLGIVASDRSDALTREIVGI